MTRFAIVAATALAALAACSGVERYIDPDADVVEDVGPDAAPDPECEPEDEICDGADNDCDGEADEDIEPEPCEGGGSRRCVLGQWSECPAVCSVCVPGTRRECFEAYCTGWGVQTCASSGAAWGTCEEASVPNQCDDGSGWAPTEPSTGACCINQGYCCQDYWDLDGDGQTADSVGDCYGIDCHP